MRSTERARLGREGEVKKRLLMDKIAREPELALRQLLTGLENRGIVLSYWELWSLVCGERLILNTRQSTKPPGTEGIEPGAAYGGDSDRLARRIAMLTPQQTRVLMMMKAGLLNKQIAFELHISVATVKAHVCAILQKLDVYNRTQAVIAASCIGGEKSEQMTTFQAANRCSS